MKAVHQFLTVDVLKSGTISLDKIRIDSTLVKSNITPPSDSQLLAKKYDFTGLKISILSRFTNPDTSRTTTSYTRFIKG